jgi:Fic family protein
MDNDRRYVTSHPWIRFSLDLSRGVPYTLWLLLGAAESKCKHLAGIPLRPEKQEEITHLSLRRGVRATTAIEGNSLSEEEIRRIVENDPTDFPKSKEYQRREVLNVTHAYKAIAEEIDQKDSCRVDYEQLLLDNSSILQGLELEEVTPGKIRTHSVSVGRYLGAPAEDCDFLLRKLFDWLLEDWGGLRKEHGVIEGILKAIMAHLYIAWIHPFADGNGRSARMLEFRLLMAAGVPLTAAHLLTSHYNDKRTEYYGYLEATSRKAEGDYIPFLLYALQGFVDALDEQIQIILREQVDVTWENYVHNSEFNGKLSEAQARQRKLLLELSALPRPVSPAELRKSLSDRLLAEYSGRTIRTFNRDVNELERRDLIIRTEGERKLYAAKRRMKAFLPVCRQRKEL